MDGAPCLAGLIDVITSNRYSDRMTKRATIYFEESTHRALRLKAAETDQSISDLVNDAVRQSLAEDADDLAAFRERAAEPALKFEEFVVDLKRRGQL